MFEASQRLRWVSWLSCALFAGLAGLAGLAGAQTTPPSTPASTVKPTPSVSSPTATTATRRALTGEIYRWVDAKGKVQYGSEVPEDRQSTARKIDTRGNIVSSRVPASIGNAAVKPPSNDAAPAQRQPITEREKCEAAWEKYRASQECFAQLGRDELRTRAGAGSGGRVRPGSRPSEEAAQKCESLTEPQPCR